MVNAVSVTLGSGFRMPAAKLGGGLGVFPSYMVYMRRPGKPGIRMPEQGYVAPNQPRSCCHVSPSETLASKRNTESPGTFGSPSFHSKNVLNSGHGSKPV